MATKRCSYEKGNDMKYYSQNNRDNQKPVKGQKKMYRFIVYASDEIRGALSQNTSTEGMANINSKLNRIKERFWKSTDILSDEDEPKNQKSNDKKDKCLRRAIMFL
jgi:hypothetical protein